jgi:hypothetical protein
MSKPTWKMLCVGLGLFCLIFSPVIQLGAQESAFAKKYAVVVGDYEFDMSEMGMGVMTINVYVEDDALWAWPETSNEPAKLEPVAGEAMKFTVEDPDEGTYDVWFLKDEKGNFSQCRVTNEGQGMDVTGTKKEK